MVLRQEMKCMLDMVFKIIVVVYEKTRARACCVLTRGKERQGAEGAEEGWGVMCLRY